MFRVPEYDGPTQVDIHETSYVDDALFTTTGTAAGVTEKAQQMAAVVIEQGVLCGLE